MQYLESAARSAHQGSARWMSFGRWIRRSSAVLITLAAPAISFSGALTTGLKGTSPAVTLPPGYGVSLAATVAATTLAAVLAALIARRDALVAIPASLGIWLITGLSVIYEGAQLGHTGLTLWGVILAAASLTAAAAGMPLAAHRGKAGQQSGGGLDVVSHPRSIGRARGVSRRLPCFPAPAPAPPPAGSAGGYDGLAPRGTRPRQHRPPPLVVLATPHRQSGGQRIFPERRHLQRPGHLQRLERHVR